MPNFQKLSPSLHIISVILVLAGGSFGCVTSGPHSPTPPAITSPPTQEELQARVKVEYDEFRGITTYTGATFTLEESPQYPRKGAFILFGGIIKPNYALLRAEKAKPSSITEFQIVIRDLHRSKSPLYFSAWDSHGVKLDLVAIDDGNSSTETIAINVLRQYLETYKNTGIRFKVVGKRGEQIFFLPAINIKAFLAKVTQNPKSLPGPIPEEPPSEKLPESVPGHLSFPQTI